jgi:hypothetical protein
MNLLKLLMGSGGEYESVILTTTTAIFAGGTSYVLGWATAAILSPYGSISVAPTIAGRTMTDIYSVGPSGGGTWSLTVGDLSGVWTPSKSLVLRIDGTTHVLPPTTYGWVLSGLASEPFLPSYAHTIELIY